jgi:hypothetical protein
MFEDVDVIKAYFVDIATYPHYDSCLIEKLVNSLSQQSRFSIV